ncbi:MAG: ABC transporter permease, partial [Pseudomonadota bacterium]
MANHDPVQRAEFVREVEASAFGVIEKPLTTWEKVCNNAAVRKCTLLLILAVIWQVYATMLNSPLLFPKFSETFIAFYEGVKSGVLLERGWFSVKVLLQGYAAGLFLAAILTAFEITSRVGNDLLETLTSMFNP